MSLSNDFLIYLQTIEGCIQIFSLWLDIVCMTKAYDYENFGSTIEYEYRSCALWFVKTIQRYMHMDAMNILCFCKGYNSQILIMQKI